MGYKRQALNHYRVLVALLYGKHSFLHQMKDGRCFLRLGPFCKRMRIPSTKMRDNLQALVDMGLITELEMDYGCAQFYVARPVNDFSPEVVGE